MSPLAQLRAQGLHITAAGGHLLVSPRKALGDAARTTIRVNKATILRELQAEASEREAAIVAARDAAGLAEWRAPLLLGRLRLCGKCAHFTFGPEPPSFGTCSLHGGGLLPFLPFDCPDFASNPRAEKRRILTIRGDSK